MPLEDLPLRAEGPGPPPEVRRFLCEARRRVDRFVWEHHLPAFVPSDFERTYAALADLGASGRPAGRWFCEWGSGFGVTACLAALLGFDAWGIEIEGELVAAARRLAGDFGLPAEFVRGSFIPARAGAFAAAARGCAWLAGAGECGHGRLGLAPDDFDVIFAYPWPDEQRLTAALFERYARPGALLLTYHEDGALRLRRKRPAHAAGRPRPG